MIIDKVQAYWTEADREQLAAIRAQQSALLQAMKEKREAGSADLDAVQQWGQLEEKANSLSGEIEQRYLTARSKAELFTDAKEIVNAITQADFLQYIIMRVSQIEEAKADGASEKSLAILRDLAAENYQNCYYFCLSLLRVQFNALAPDLTEKAISLIEARIEKWYVKPAEWPITQQEWPAKPQESYFLMAHGKATDALAFMNTKRPEIDPITHDATVSKFGVELGISKFEELRTALGISTDKLLSFAIGRFTQQNNFRHANPQLKRDVSIPLKEYLGLLDYDVEERATSTKEESEREKKRVKNQIDNGRKAIKKDLDLIHAITLTWKETIKGKLENYVRQSLVTRTGISDGKIQMSFAPEIAEYFAKLNLITPFPIKLLKLDSRKPNAYYIGRKLSEYYNIDNNQLRGTYDRISIPSLLAVTDLASYDEVQATDRGHWQKRIKEPFERALDELVKVEYLADWEYTHAKGIPLTDNEAENINSYDDFASLYLHFRPFDTIHQQARIEAKQQAREKARKKTGKAKAVSSPRKSGKFTPQKR